MKAPAASAPAVPTPGSGPVIVVETVKGTFEFETYPNDAPKTVAHVVNLAKRGFYNGMRFHRVVPGFIVQVGDPQSRDMSKREWWGRGDFAAAARPSALPKSRKKHLHVRGAVAMAHPGNPAEADAQFYITLTAQPKLDGKVRSVRTRHQRHGRAAKHPGRRRRQEDVREAVTGAFTTRLSSKGYRSTSSGG